MKFYCISDNIDTSLGMRLSGIEGAVVHEKDEFVRELKKAFDDESVGIVLVTEKLIKLDPELVFDYKLNNRRPLIVEIPDRHGTSDISGSIARYIKEAVGVEI